ncbi:MAG: hypothetical protein KIG22_03595 [Oxalobacter sp.]|nr:hypothetical protein [Oxalobacter sp.]
MGNNLHHVQSYFISIYSLHPALALAQAKSLISLHAPFVRALPYRYF